MPFKNTFKKAKHDFTLFLVYLLPRHGQRLVLWSTLYNEYCNQKKIKTNVMEDLNKAIDIARTEKACVFPIKLGESIKSDLTSCMDAVSDAMGDKPIAQCAQKFTENLPKWLRYASDRFIKEDFEKIILANRNFAVA